MSRSPIFITEMHRDVNSASLRSLLPAVNIERCWQNASVPQKGRMKKLTMRAGLFVLACLAQPLHAQEYPARNVTMIVPFPAGGGADLFARLIGQQLTVIFGKTFVIDNRVGASGNIGANAVVRSAPDGL